MEDKKIAEGRAAIEDDDQTKTMEIKRSIKRKLDHWRKTQCNNIEVSATEKKNT